MPDNHNHLRPWDPPSSGNIERPAIFVPLDQSAYCFCNIGERDVGLEHLLGNDDAELGVELRGAAVEHRGLARAGGTGDHDRLASAYTAAQECGDLFGEHSPIDELIKAPERDPGEPPDVHHEMTAPGDVAVDDVKAGTVVELSVLEPFARIELAMGTGRVVEDLREDAYDVGIVMEDLVVVAAWSAVALHEDRVPDLFFI